MEFGTEVYKLVRVTSPDTSHEAAASIDTTRLEQMVYNTIKSFGPSGCISDEVIAKHPGFAYSSITARYKALSEKGYIVFSGAKKPGKSGRSQRVMIAP